MDENNVASVVKDALTNGNCLELKLEHGLIKVFPHLFIYVDGILTLVGEDISNRVLVNIPENYIHFVIVDEVEYQVNFALMQVEEYVKELRTMNGKEDRLILKIRAGQNVKIVPPYQLLNNTYVVNTPGGDIIWASTIEMHKSLFEWYFQIKDKVEIIAPESFKKDFMNYLEKCLLENSKYFSKVF